MTTQHLTASDLMIGDYITTKDSLETDDSPLIFRIVCPGYDGENGALVVLKGEKACDEIEIDEEWCGIPLTPEILEKNGFWFGYTTDEEDLCGSTGAGYSEKGWCWDDGAGTIKIIFPTKTDGGLVLLDDANFDRVVSFVFMNTIFVHDLQHCLKIIGINKEIEL